MCQFGWKMERNEVDPDEKALLHPTRALIERRPQTNTPIVISSPHLDMGLVAENCSLEKLYWPQTYENSMNLFSRSLSMRSPQSPSMRSPPMRSPSIRGDRYVVPSLKDPELNNVIPALHQYNGFSDDANEPLLTSNEHLKASLNGDYEDHLEKNQVCISAQGHLVVLNLKDELSSLKEIQGISLFEASLNGINILAGRTYKIYVRLCSSCRHTHTHTHVCWNTGMY